MNTKQDSIHLGTHGEDYGSWMSNIVFITFGCIAAAAVVAAALFLTVISVPALGVIFAVLAVAMIVLLCWCGWIRRQYAFDGGGVMEKVHKTVISNLDYDGKGTLLDVGCGAGPLSIRAALTWPETKVVGVDYYGKDFGYTPETCRRNASSEGVGSQCTFCRGDANKLDFADESFDAVVSVYVYHNVTSNPDKQALLLETLRTLKKGGSFVIIDSMKRQMYGDMDAFVKKLKDMGYQDVRLVDADELIYGSEKAGKMLMVGGAKLLLGKK